MGSNEFLPKLNIFAGLIGFDHSNLYDDPVIVSRDNPKLREIRRAKYCKDHRALLEGPHLIREAASASVHFDSILATPEFMRSAAAEEVLTCLPFSPIEVASNLLEEFADSDSPRGIVGVARLQRGGIEALVWSADSIFIFVDGIQDPGNLGALARVAEATGVSGLILAPGTVHPNHPRALRASAGSLLRLPVVMGVNPNDLGASLPESLTAQWVGLIPRGGELLQTTALKPPLVLALGSEGLGLSTATQDLISTEISVPMQAPVESLNVAVTAAVVLYELLRRRAT